MATTPSGVLESYDRPREIYALSIKSGTERSWYRQSVRADVAQLVTDLVFYPSKDGTKVPLFLFHRKDTRLDGSAPTLLFGYGAANAKDRPAGAHCSCRGSSAEASTRSPASAAAASTARRGTGREASATSRTRSRTSSRPPSTSPASATCAQTDSPRAVGVGGLLVAATLTQRPDLFRAVDCLVPQTDMIRFPLTGLGTTPLAEFGDPQDPDDFRVLLSYSPYHRVARGTRYPAVLISAAETDERVDPMHARKFAAALQDASTGGEVLLRVDWDLLVWGSAWLRPRRRSALRSTLFCSRLWGSVSSRIPS